MDLLFVLLGVGLLYLGGDRLITDSSKLGGALKMSPMVVGLTLVAFGTSAPEMATTLNASWRGASAMAFGNVVGSNIANLGLILGITAMLYPIETHARFLKREMPIVILVGVLLLPVLDNGVVGRREGLFFLFLLIPYLMLLFRSKEEEKRGVEKTFAQEFGDGTVSIPKAALGVLVGCGVLVAGAHLLINGAVGIARDFEVSERIIGLTLLSLGTSLPELASCLCAARKGEGDIVLGNLAGSNIFNVLAVLGSAALINPIAVPTEGVALDLFVMIGVSVVVLGLIIRDRRLSRFEGLLLTTGYILYVGFLYSG